MKKALVQVKSTDSRQTSVIAKLSALKRLVDSDLPAFILHMEFSRDQSPTRVRLLHIDRSEIAIVQQAVRKAEHAGRIDFHNIDIRLPLKAAKPLALGGGDAGDAIYDVIPQDPHNYGVSKAEFRKSCGYDEKSFSGGFSLASGLTERDLAYLLVGRTPKLALSKFVVQSSRFGISLSGEKMHLEEGDLYVEAKPFGKGKVTAVALGGIRRATLSVNVYGSGGADLLPENRILRLSSEFIEWIIHLSSREDDFQFRIDPKKRFLLPDLSRAMSFASILQDAGTSIMVEIGGRHVTKFTPLEQAKFYQGWETLSRFCAFLNDACNRSWSDQPIEISLEDLGKALDSSAQMYSAATQPGANFVFSGETEISVPPGAKGYIFLPICIEFAGLVYTAVVKADAPPYPIPKGRISFTGAKPEVIQEAITTRYDGLHKQLNALIDSLARDTIRPGLWIVTVKVGHSETGSVPRKMPRRTNLSRQSPLHKPKKSR